MENKDWKSKAKSYSENVVFGSSLRTFYDEKREIVHCENASIDREELLKTIKRLGNNDLIKELLIFLDKISSRGLCQYDK